MAVYTTIDDPSAHFQATIYSGTGSTASVTNGGNSDLQPDFVWIKCRTGNARDNRLLDSTRGVQKELVSNSTAAEYTEATGFTAFQSDGFQHGGANGYGASDETYVAWQWKANGGTRSTFTESGANPGGGYQANTTGGFSIVDYTGTGAAGTMAHGLGAVPHVIFVKSRTGAADSDGDWNVYHHKNTSAPETDFLILNETTATQDAANRWNDTAPTSSVFTVGTTTRVNEDADNYIAYCFAPIQGYSKFGSYTGNGASDGTFVYTGFKTAWVMVKKTSASGSSWLIFDNKRPGYNGTGHRLYANATDTEDTDTGDSVDLLSNGFKFRGGSSSSNQNAATFIYMAFAEHPFVSSEGVPCTAR